MCLCGGLGSLVMINTYINLGGWWWSVFGVLLYVVV